MMRASRRDGPVLWGVYPHAHWKVTDHRTGDGHPEETGGGFVVREVSPGVPYGRMKPVRTFKRRSDAEKLADRMTFGPPQKSSRDPGKRVRSYVTPEMRREKRGVMTRAGSVAEEAMALYWRTHERLLTAPDKRKIRALYTRANRIVDEAAKHEYVQRSGIPFEVRDLEYARRQLHEAKTEHGLHTRRSLNSIVSSMNAIRQFAQRTGVRDQSRVRRGTRTR